MSHPHSAVDEAVKALDRLRRTLKSSTTRQVRSTEELSLVKAMSLAWFNSFRPIVATIADDELLEDADASFKGLMAASDKATTRARYDELLKEARRTVTQLRSYTLAPPSAPSARTADTPPDFQSLVADPKMRAVLERRWTECATCIASNAPLAATVMMGGLLEALLLARVHREANKSPIFGAKAAPRDHKSGKPLQLQEWTLRHYIDVAHELDWISSSAKDVGEVVRDYRNYIHPFKELSHGVHLRATDAELFWEISKNISRQLLT